MTAANPAAPCSCEKNVGGHSAYLHRAYRALEAENATLKAELAARPNYGTASNHSVWALQRDRIKELEARARAYERHLAEVHGCTCDEVDPDALEVLTKKEAP